MRLCVRDENMSWLSRTEAVFGREAVASLARRRVAVFGLGGVGGYTVEALARSGVGALDLIDGDSVSESNLNRQILATRDTIGRAKAEVAAERVRAINPDCAVTAIAAFFLPENAGEFDFSAYDYVVDAIDTVAGKLALAECATAAAVPIISAMGAGNKRDVTAFRVADISATTVCPLARVMRRELRKRGIEHLKVVYSAEPPFQREPVSSEAETGRVPPGSTAFAPAAAGILLAAETVKDLIALGEKRAG